MSERVIASTSEQLFSEVGDEWRMIIAWSGGVRRDEYPGPFTDTEGTNNPAIYQTSESVK